MQDNTHVLTLIQLRDKAQALLDKGTDPNTPVSSEGCDCIGAAQDLIVCQDYVLLERVPGA